MPTLRCLILTPAQAAAVVAVSADRQLRLEPRLVAAGPYAGSSVLPVRILDDWLPRFPVRVQAAALALPQDDVDTTIAWPDPDGLPGSA